MALLSAMNRVAPLALHPIGARTALRATPLDAQIVRRLGINFEGSFSHVRCLTSFSESRNRSGFQGSQAIDADSISHLLSQAAVAAGRDSNDVEALNATDFINPLYRCSQAWILGTSKNCRQELTSSEGRGAGFNHPNRTISVSGSWASQSWPA